MLVVEDPRAFSHDRSRAMGLVAEAPAAPLVVQKGERPLIRLVRGLQPALEALEVAQHLVCPRQLPGSAAAPLEDIDGLSTEASALRIVEARSSLEGRLEEVVGGLPPHLAACEMEGQSLVELRETVCVELLDHAARRQMQLAPPLPEQRFIGDVVGQRVLEHVLELG